MNNTGNFCFCCRLKELSRLNKDAWLEEMIRNSSLVHSEEPDDAQCRAWLSSFKVLKAAKAKLPKAYGDIWLVFEYVLPKHKPGTKKYENENGVRPDVLLVGSNFVTVLEFKQRKLDEDGSVYGGYISQAEKYVTRLNKYHSASADKYVAPILVLVLAKDLLEDRDSIVISSADRLSDALVLLNGDNPESLSDREMDLWLRWDL